jgi:hypothetical protein
VRGVAQFTLAWILALSEAAFAASVPLDAPHAVRAARLAPAVITNANFAVEFFIFVTFVSVVVRSWQSDHPLGNLSNNGRLAPPPALSK